MPINENIDTSDLIRVERSVPLGSGPSLDAPSKSPFYISQLPTTSIINPDNVRNFHNPTIPSYRIIPPLPLTLSGAASNSVASVKTAPSFAPQPPAPIVSQTLVSIPTGYQFAFLQVRQPASVPPGATIITYRVYRNSSNNTGGATVIDTIPHNPANVGDPIVVQDSQPNGSTFFYWASSINASGIESTLTPAQSGTVVNNAALNANSQIASSFHSTALNVAFVPQSATALSNSGSTTVINVAATTNRFAPAGVSYNSGSVDPGFADTLVVFADDPQFQGGAVIYQFCDSSVGAQNQVSNDGRLPFGKISTSTSPSTGGGNTGGTGGAGNAGGRGFLVL
jgi:hypothetical protein